MSEDAGYSQAGLKDFPAQVCEAEAERPFSVYMHVPYCRVRCGYCDFNTYTNLEMGSGASATDFVSALVRDAELTSAAMDRAGVARRPVHSVFIGGGTPTILPPADLARMVACVRDVWGMEPGVEVTTEANPDTLTQATVEALAAAGVTRVSVGMQSAVPQVLATLDRTHEPRRVPEVVAWVKQAGLSVSVDLIYGTPGETLEQWACSLEAAVAMDPDHVSAYALVVEEGTKMGRDVRRGLLEMPSADDEATKYEMAESALSAAGYQWYEISNWARAGAQCRHNVAYWTNADWCGLGPGAHSHLGRVRLWEKKAPVAWARAVQQGVMPIVGYEVIDDAADELERVMLAVRLREGLRLAEVVRPGEETTALGTPRRLVPVVADLVREGLVEPCAALSGRVVLTLRGRLMADAVTRSLTS